MAPVRKTLQQYILHRDRLDDRLRELRQKLDLLTSTNTASGSPQSQSALATEILIQIIQVKLSFLNERITSLQSLVNQNPRQTTPIDLQLSRFDDWVETNQQLYELNTQLYERQRNMLEDRLTLNNLDSPEPQDSSLTIQNSIEPDSVLRTFKTASTGLTNTYISERLRPKNNRMTFEAMKIDEYVRECTQYQGGTLEDPPTDTQGQIRGAHPQAYHRFVELLCNYITQRHSSSQGQELQAAEVYTAIEHQLIPCIKPFITSYVTEQDKDKRLNAKCVEFEGATLSQLRVPVEYQTKELIPFATAIAYLKGSYFAASPTDKMYSIVKAAKSLHDIVGMGDAGGIDGDTFLDLWIYVTIKANMKDMATNVKLMSEYGNPQLSIGEAGYYLTTITAAMNYIEGLTHDKLGKQIENDSTFLVCEKVRAKAMCDTVGSGIEMVQEDIELTGYRIAVVRLWALDSSKLFKTILFHTGDQSDKVMVTMIRLSSAHSSPSTIEYLYDILTEPQIPWVTCTSIMNCLTRVADPTIAIKEQLIVLPPWPANTDESLDILSYVLQLIRASSDTLHKNDDREMIRSMSFKQSTQRKFEMSDSVLEVNDHRSRFSLPVRRFLSTKSRKSTKSSIQREYSAGNWVNDNDGDDRWLLSRPKDTSPGPTQGLSRGIVVTAEVHSSASPIKLSTFDTDGNSIEKDSGNQLVAEESSHDSGVNSGGTINFFSTQFRESLEGNFLSNHYNGNNGGNTPFATNVKKCFREIIQQAQLVLQRLGYLSPLHKLDGVYDDIVMNAVQLYQINQNEHKVPLDGILTVQVAQFMRQDYITRLKSLVSIFKDGTVDNNTVTRFSEFPLSIKQEDCDSFKSLVSTLQHKAGITQQCSRVGVLCDETHTCVKKLSHAAFV